MNPSQTQASKGRLNYQDSGVDVQAGDHLVDWLSQDQNWVRPQRIVSGIGGFASLYRAHFPEMKKPCLVTCTDGIGTKVKLASHFGEYESVGQDLVAMCVNDLICTGATPLLFLDYYATGKLDLTAAQKFLSGVRKACLESYCDLVGGETAEMPGVYQNSDFDAAGFAVGIVDEENFLGPHRVQEGDRLLGVSSSGFHSNGYSLLRKVFDDDLEKWRSILLTPTALYVELMKQLLESKIQLHAAAHITGGGIENIPRVIPENLVWDPKDWLIPDSFLEVQRRTGMSREELKKTLNCGVGFALVLSPQDWQKASEIVGKNGFQVLDLGQIISKSSHQRNLNEN